MPDITSLFQGSDAVNRNLFNQKISDINAHGNDTTRHVTEKEREVWSEGITVSYKHTKNGRVHDLIGNGNNISFLATADIAEGDTWTVNGNPVMALLQNGEALPSELFKSGCWVPSVRLDENKLFFKSRSILTPEIFGDGRDGVLNINTNLALAIPGEYATRDLNYVEKQYKSIYIGPKATLYPSDNNMGMVVRVQGDCTIDGTISNSASAGRRLKKGSSHSPFFASLVAGKGGKGGKGGGNGQSATGGTGGTGSQASGSDEIGGGGMSGGAGGGASVGQYSDQQENGFSGRGASGITDTTERSKLFANGGYGSGGDGATTRINRELKAFGGYGSGNSGDSGKYLEYRYHYGGAGGGAGNYGGGIILLIVGGNLIINGSIVARGGDGGDGGSAAGYGAYHTGGPGGGGGGAGGGALWILYRKSYRNVGILNVNGGAGGREKSGYSDTIKSEAGEAGGIGTINVKKYKKGDYYFGAKG